MSCSDISFGFNDTGDEESGEKSNLDVIPVEEQLQKKTYRAHKEKTLSVKTLWPCTYILKYSKKY